MMLHLLIRRRGAATTIQVPAGPAVQAAFPGPGSSHDPNNRHAAQHHFVVSLGVVAKFLLIRQICPIAARLVSSSWLYSSPTYDGLAPLIAQVFQLFNAYTLFFIARKADYEYHVR